MANKRELVMKFKTDEGKKVSVRVKDVKDGLDKDTIVAAMDTLIEKNIFATTYKEKDSAFIVSTETKEVKLV